MKAGSLIYNLQHNENFTKLPDRLSPSKETNPGTSKKSFFFPFKKMFQQPPKEEGI